MAKGTRVSPPIENRLRADEEGFRELFKAAALRTTWRKVKKALRFTTVRDALDWIDCVHQIDTTLTQLVGDIVDGSYRPRPATSFELAKSKGSFRFMAIPSVLDSLVYRHLADAILKKATPFKVKGAYYSQRGEKITPVGPHFDGQQLDVSSQFFVTWLYYNEYRTRTLLNQPHSMLVTTDISNYFDSIQHSLLFEYIAPLGLPRKAVALLGRILDTLKPTSGHSPNPRVGLPIDELDCSRALAHVFLFEHDHRVVKVVGEDNYVRWMDDQNIGAKTESEARRVVNVVTRSLAEQRLTINSGKTRFLSPQDVHRQFHLDTNDLITKWEKRWSKSWPIPQEGKTELMQIWTDAPGRTQPDGNWSKVLKRLYAWVARAGEDWLDEHAYEHLVRHPELHRRIFESLALRSRVNTMLRLFQQYVSNGECLFEATEALFFDALLRADASKNAELSCRRFIREFAKRLLPHDVGRPLGLASSAICYYWHGGKPISFIDLVPMRNWAKQPAVAVRAVLSTTFALEPRNFRAVLPYLASHPSEDVGRLAQFLAAVEEGAIDQLDRFASRRRRWPLGGYYYDARAWLTLETLSHVHTRNRQMRAWVKHQARTFERYARTRQELRVWERIASRLSL